MKALLYRDWDTLEVAEVETPVPERGEVLIHVEACGLCGSEIECVLKRLPRRQPPLILGHEFCGRVAEYGPGVTGFARGDAVIVNSVIPCRECHACRRGDTNLCSNRRLFGMDRPGGCAEYVTAPASVVYRRPEGIGPVQGALVEPAANGVHAASLLPHLEKKTVFVFGAGVIGLMALQAVRALHEARVAVADLSPARLSVARALGAKRIVTVGQEDAVRAAMEFSGADGVDYVIDAVGAVATKAQSLAMARPGGGVCWIGLHDDRMALDTYAVTLPQKTVVGSYAATEDEFLLAARLLASGAIRGGDGIKPFPMDQAVEAFRRLANPTGDDLKAVILP